MNLHENIYRFVYEKTRDAIIIVSAENRLIKANPSALDTFISLQTLREGDELGEDVLPGYTALVSGNQQEIKVDLQTFECQIFDCVENGESIKFLWLTNITDRKDFIAYARDYQFHLKKTIQSKIQHIVEIQNNVLMNMADVIEDRDGNTGGHVKRTSTIVRMLLTEMQKDKEHYPELTPEWCEIVARLAPLHDMGKMSISDTILNKPGKLSAEEFDIMKTHATKGKEVVNHILAGVEDQPHVIMLCENIAQFHHEKWDGSGYPQKLRGEEIPLEARIMAIADVYDALVSKRAYKPSMSFEAANKIMTDSFGSHFDPHLQKYYDTCRPQIEAYYKGN